jgi:hypothetical protein
MDLSASVARASGGVGSSALFPVAAARCTRPGRYVSSPAPKLQNFAGPFCCQESSGSPRRCLGRQLHRSNEARHECQHVVLPHRVTLSGVYNSILVTVSINPGTKLEFHNPVETLAPPHGIAEDGGGGRNRTGVRHCFLQALTCVLTAQARTTGLQSL